jgi:hypothetical protein
MPFKSSAQRNWAHTPSGLKALGGKAKVHEWDEASKGMQLPEYKAAYGGKVPEEKDMKSLHQRAAEAAIQHLMDRMDDDDVESLKGMKEKPIAAEMSITKLSPEKKMDSWGNPRDEDEEEMHESPEEEASEDEDDEEPSEEDKNRIAEMYKKYCKGM